MLSRAAMLRRAVIPTRTPVLRRAMTTVKPGHESEIRPAFTYAPDKAAAEAFIKLEQETAEHSGKTGDFWLKVSIFVVTPVILATAYHTYVVEAEHYKHHKEHPRPSDDELPAEYEYRNIRKTKFFWGDGDKTLFWNPEYNHKKED